LLADTDGDGLTDAEEVNGDPATDPSNEDTDGDGFRDAFEIAQDSDPNDPSSLPEDRLGEPTLTWAMVQELPSFDGIEGGADLLDASFRVWIDFEEKLDGERELIFETGGATIGHSVVYEAPNKLVYRADGNGGFSLSVIEHTLTADQLAAGEIEVIWTYDARDADGVQTIALYLDGVSVGSESMDLGGDWSGANAAAFGVASAALAGDGQNNVLTAEDFQSGAINEVEGLQFFADRLFIAGDGGGGDGGDPPAGDLPVILSVVKTADATDLTWQAAAGVTVQVEYSADLSAGSWTAIGDSDTGSYSDVDDGRQSRASGFYRVTVAP
jgi:hypothetical protein